MTDHGAAAVHAWHFRFSLRPVITWATRRATQHPVLVAAAVLVVGGGAAGAAVGLNSSSAVQPAGGCPVTGGYYAYAVPQDPAHPPAAGSGPTSWGWTPRNHQVRVGDRMRLNGRLWRVTEIASMPGVEPVGRRFAIIGWPGIRLHRVSGKLVPVPTATGNTSLTMCGRLVFRPAS
jgi:hypothetical protein